MKKKKMKMKKMNIENNGRHLYEKKYSPFSLN